MSKSTALEWTQRKTIKDHEDEIKWLISFYEIIIKNKEGSD